MAFVVGVIGVAVVGAAAHGNHSDYGCHSRHSNYREYGDSALVSAINNKKNEIDAKETEVDNLQERMERNFQERIERLKAEKNYSSFNYSDAEDIIENVKEEMREELDDEISQDKQELAEIDKMIARINELELQSKRE